MKKPHQWLQWVATMSLILIATVFFSLRSYAAADTPVGLWKTVDDKSGQILSVVQIYPAAQGKLEGKIVKIMPVLGQKNTDVCSKCKGEQRNKPMLGLVIMHNMRQLSQNTWGGGTVLDPKSGNVYSGTMKLINNGESLQLRGYVGIPMFGRSETWIRSK